MNEKLLLKFNEVEKSHWWWEGRRELLKIFLKGRRPSRILDIGSGTGETLNYLKSLFPKAELFGIDTSKVALKYAKKRGHKNIFKSSALKLPFEDGFFDTVLFLDVLEHVKNDLAAIKEAKRVLKPGGVLVITAPALSFIWSAHDTEQGHKRRYTRTRVKMLAKGAGLELEFISYFNFLLCFPIIIIRLLSNIKLFRRFADYDNSLNYDVVNLGLVNSLLGEIFVSEIKLLKYIRYPIGISIAVKLQK